MNSANTPQPAGPPSPEARADLAPHGKLRLAFPAASALYVTKDPVTGALKGVSMDIGTELAARLGVPFEPLPCTAVRDLIAATGADRWDIATIVMEAERAETFDYSRAYIEADSTYLVPAGSAIRAVAEADKPGTRIGVAVKSAFDNFLTRTIKNATLVRYPGVAAAFERLARSTNAMRWRRRARCWRRRKGNFPARAFSTTGSTWRGSASWCPRADKRPGLHSSMRS